MKILTGAIIITLSFSAFGQAQQTSTVSAPTPYSIVHRDANSRIWQSTTYEVTPSGQTIPHNHYYTELATGLCYKQNGQWEDSQEQINILPDGTASATAGQHQAYFPADIYQGNIRLVTPDALQLNSRPVGLVYDDGSNTVLIAALTNSIGQLVGANQVIYTNAFTGVSADLLYTYTKTGFEQDVVLNQQPPPPESYGLKLQTTRLELITEFFNPPSPVMTTAQLPPQAGLSLSDDTLRFGNMQMVPGRAFLLGPNAEEGQAMVGKQWLSLDGRQFLLEEVPVAALKNQLSQLPAAQVSVATKGSLLNIVSEMRLLPPQRLVKSGAKQLIQISKIGMPKRGLLLDYQTINSSQTNVTFQGDSTYYISGTVNLFGTNTFEGGTVIKYATNGCILQTGGQLNWLGDAYLPVIFTAKDDNLIGDTISGSSGTPSGYYASPEALGISSMPSACELSDFRILWAKQALYLSSPNSVSLYNGQLVNCQSGINAQNDKLYIRNMLFANMQTNFLFNAETADVENVTFSGSTYLIGYFGSGIGNFTNCILANVTNLIGSYGSIALNASYNGFYKSAEYGNNVVTNTFYPFQTVGGGSYYLTNGCSFHSAGTPNVDPDLWDSLPTKTTHGPIVYSGTNFYSNQALSPVVSRDTNSSPDLGYHYDPLDYVFSGCDVYSNMMASAGTAIGWAYSDDSHSIPASLVLNNGANVSFNGTGTAPCYFSRHTMVQETVNGAWNDNTGWHSGAITFNGSSTSQEPLLYSGFTKWTSDDASTYFRDSPAYGSGGFVNSEMYGASASSYDMQTLNFSNCLFFRGQLTFWDQDYAVSFAFENCTFYNGGLFYGRYSGNGGDSSSFWLLENCSFDGTLIYWADNLNADPANTLFNYNAYNTNNLSWMTYNWPYGRYGTNEVVGPNDVMVTNYNWQSNWFGDFYLPTNSPLIRKGSTNANLLGLSGFTTQTNQMPEGTNIVDIGYHYMALPVITQQPANCAVFAGGTAVFSVSATGAPPLDYQWFSGTWAVSSGTNASLTLTNVQSSQGGDYWVSVSNPAGSAASSNALLTVFPLPSISLNPTNQILVNGQNETADFSGLISGTNAEDGLLSYQWLFNGTNLGDVITTVAGGGTSIGTDGLGDGDLATNAILNAPNGVALDGMENLYIADANDNIIRKVNPNGEITTVAGDYINVTGYTGDGGPSIRAYLKHPQSVCKDAHGNLYIADAGDDVIRMINTNGVISTVAGIFGEASYGSIGSGNAATNVYLNDPSSVALDAHGNLYIADTYNNLIRMVNTNGMITTVAGTPYGYGYSGDGGWATNALLGYPEGVAVDTNGNLYIADTANDVIREVRTNGYIWTVAGTNNQLNYGVSGYSGDGGPATNALLNSPQGVAVDTQGALYIADTVNDAIRVVKSNGIIWTAAGTNNLSGNGETGYSGDGGQATNALLSYPQGVALDAKGNLYIADTWNDAIRVVKTNSTIWTVAGTNDGWNYGDAGYWGDGGPATNALLDNPEDAFVDVQGNLYIADAMNNVIRVVNSNNVITTVAGSPSGERYFGDGGAATNAIFFYPQGVAMDAHGNLYIADTYNDVIRMVNTNGIITRIAGTPGANGYSGDGRWATNALLDNPWGVAVDTNGNVYIADTENDVIREVGTNGYIWTVAGTNNQSGYGYGGYSGDGGAATNALLAYPSGVAVDAGNSLYIADTGNDAIRKVGTNGIIWTVAGTNNQSGSGDGGYSGDGGAATNAQLSYPSAVAVDSYGNFYFSDSGNDIIRMVNTNGIITTIGGSPTEQGNDVGDGGPAIYAELNDPLGVAVDARQNVYLADDYNRVREIGNNGLNLSIFGVTTNNAGSYQLVVSGLFGSITSSIATVTIMVPPSITVQQTNIEVIEGSNADFTVGVSGTPPFSYQWYSNWVAIADATNSALFFTNVQPNDAGFYLVIVTNAAGAANSDGADLTVITPPMITTQPASQAALQGNNVTFGVTATSIVPMGYQWWFDGASLAGQTNALLVFTNVGSANVGFYDVVITNCAGSVTSAVANLTVQTRPYVSFSGLPVNLTNYTFQADTTYFVNTVITNNATTTIEGGAVLKFSTNGMLNIVGPLIFKTGPYRPALLTSMNDDSAGLPVSGSTGDPLTVSNGLAYINFCGWNWTNTNSADITISYLRIAYAGKGLADSSGLAGGLVDGTCTGSLHIWNCQFVDCNWAICDWFNTRTAVYDLHNVLFAGCQSAFGGWASTNTTVIGEQITSDTTNFWDTTSNTLQSVSLTNSIVLGNFQFDSAVVVSTNEVALAASENVFQPVGAGNYYLPWGSSYHNAGTTNISSQMLTELAQKTTCPPNVGSDETISGNQVFSTQNVPRDNGILPNQSYEATAPPDLGYHYDPIDDAFSTVDAINANIVVQPGTVIAAFASYSQTFGATYGLNIDGGSQMTCEGLANNLNHIVQYNTVQEQATSDWCEAYEGSVVCDDLGGTPSPTSTFRFTDWSIMAFDTYHLFDDSTNCAPINFEYGCQFHGGLLASTYATMDLTNCLLERVYANLSFTDGNIPGIQNDLFWHGTFDFNPGISNAVVKDNLFDQTTIPNNSLNYTNYNGGYNAFVTNQDRLLPKFANDIILTNPLAYETSYFGNYYQPTNSPLIKAGSTTADQVGLYQYTVVTNQTIEASNTVSIGYHYVATDTNGNPLCASGNGIPDYIADTNGNGQGNWADYYQGNLPLLSIIYGDSQYGYFTNFLPGPLVIQVTDNEFNSLTNAPLTFSVSNGLDELSLTNTGAAGTIVSNLFLRTDGSGNATVFIYFPSHALPTNIIFVTAQSGANSVQITSTDYVAQADTPVINPADGRFTTIQNVTISSDTPGAIVHYTVNNTNLTESSPVLPSGKPLIVSQPATVEAQAFDDNLTLPSAIQTGSFSFADPLAAGSDFTLVLEPFGGILAGGSNGDGQLGNDTTTANPDLESVLNLTDAAGIAAGGYHSLAWDTNGTAWAWGSDSNGQLGNGSSGSQKTTPTEINGVSSVMALSGGYLHSLALETNGIVYAWGYNSNGQLGNGTTTQETTPVKVNVISNIVAISAGGSHSLALASNGMVYAWGNNASGQIGDGTTTQRTTPVLVNGFSNCLEIAAGYSHSLAIASNETVVAWGDNTYGQMGNGTTSSSGQTTPGKVSGLSNIVAIAAGQYHSLALSNGIVWAWGNNAYGQLGDGTTTERTTPVPVTGLSNVLAITAGWAHSAALKSDGTVVVWGVTNYGMNGTSGQFSTVPVTADPSTNVNWQLPAIVSQPLSQTVVVADSVTFSVGATGYNLTYQWAFNGTPISGANTSTYTINNVQVNNQGAYTVTVANEMASIVSTNAQLTVDWMAATGDPFLMAIDSGPRQNYTFKSGVTYWIFQGPVQLYGQTTIEGGAIIKFDNPENSSWFFGQYWTNNSLQVLGSLNCQTGPYHPAILTSVDDDANGEISWDSSGPYYWGTVEPYPTGVPYLDLTGATTNISISNLRFGYADQGVTTPAGQRLDVWDCQFVTNNSAVMNSAGGTDCFHNVLFSGCGNAVTGSTNSFAIEAEQITACASNFWTASNGTPVTVSLTNSIILGTLGTVSSEQNVSVNPSSTNFLASWAAGYYLAGNSPLHQSGTANISLRLLDEFQSKTTCAPLVFPSLMPLNGNMTLFPRAMRYTNGPPDIGYYYDALDYIVADMTLNGGSLTLEPGTAVGSYLDIYSTNQSYIPIGFNMENGSTLTSQALPNKRNVFTDIQLVQEGFEWPVIASFVPDFFPGNGSAAPPTLNFRFSDFYLNYCGWIYYYPYNPGYASDGELADHFLAGMSMTEDVELSPDSAVYLSLRDCKVEGGGIDLSWPDTGQFGFPPDYVYGSGAISWLDNSFNDVAINISPTLNSYGYFGAEDDGPNVNMTVTAYNNLFKGGNWFFIQPIPVTDGPNWIFENNLFDVADITQDTNQPLDYAYNAYWPKQPWELLWPGNPDAAELLPTTTGDNFQDGQSEVILSNAPPYQCGPFGNFYMPTNTQLFGAGSTNAGGMQLLHYTTRLDQVIEGDEPSTHVMVDIGVHYVAATNYSSSATNYVPVDTDGDGIPDYIEDADGNGIVDTNDGTSWLTAYTQPDIWDPTNSVYLNTDLSGDGLVNRIKIALGLGPFCPTNPLTLTRVPSGEELDIVAFELPISYNVLTKVGCLSLLVDGVSPAFQECDQASDGNCLLKWNTDYDPPGQHYLQAFFTVNAFQDEQVSFVDTGTGPIVLFDSTNVAQFYSAYSRFDANGATLIATTPASPNATYTIELLTTNGGPIKTITGSTSTGLIEENWNLTYNDGITKFTGNQVKVLFDVTSSGAGSETETEWLDYWSYPSGDGNFDVSYAYNASVDYLEQSGIFWDEMQGVADTLIDPNVENFSPNYPLGPVPVYNSTFDQFSPFDILTGFPGYVSSQTVATNLVNDLASPGTENFYFYGHGLDAFSGNPEPEGQTITDGNPNANGIFGFNVVISSQWIANALTNHTSADGHVNFEHPYRFVFMDSCSSAKFPNLQYAFGIADVPLGAMPLPDPGTPRAFLGWTNPKVGLGAQDATETTCNDYGTTLNLFYDLWMSGNTLDECIRACSVNYRNSDGSINLNGLHLPLPIPGTEQCILSDGTHFNRTGGCPPLKLVGYPGLTRFGYDPSYSIGVKMY